MSFIIKNKEKLIEELKKRPLTTYEDEHKFKILTDEDFEKYNKKSIDK